LVLRRNCDRVGPYRGNRLGPHTRPTRLPDAARRNLEPAPVLGIDDRVHAFEPLDTGSTDRGIALSSTRLLCVRLRFFEEYVVG
jgi:hypothetical protein